MSKSKSHAFEDLTPGPDTASSDVNLLREPEAVAASTKSTQPAPAAKDEIQDDRLRPYFRLEGGKAWAKGPDGFVPVDHAKACIAAAQLGSVDDSARAAAAAAIARDHAV
jgi:hypothetical protein